MRVIYVDDESPALDNFRLTVSAFPEIRSVELFQNVEDALDWVKTNPVDVAFLDVEIPGGDGIALAKLLRELNPSVRVIFVTAHSEYAMDAWGVDAVGYVLKPYAASDLRKELNKAIRYRPMPIHRVEIRTIPSFSVMVDGEPLYLSRSKARELFALLVDRGERGITTGEGISCLWPERPNDTNTQSLFRMTYKRLADALEKAGVGHIVASLENRRVLRTDLVDCDLYRIMEGDELAARQYDGQYMQEYSWAEDRNGQLYRMLLHNEKK